MTENCNYKNVRTWIWGYLQHSEEGGGVQSTSEGQCLNVFFLIKSLYSFYHPYIALFNVNT